MPGKVGAGDIVIHIIYKSLPLWSLNFSGLTIYLNCISHISVFSTVEQMEMVKSLRHGSDILYARK